MPSLEITKHELTRLPADVATALGLLRRRYLAEHWPERSLPGVEASAIRFERLWCHGAGAVWIAHHAEWGPVAYHLLVPRGKSASAACVLCVLPEARGRGIARALLREGHSFSAAHGIAEMEAESSSLVPEGDMLLKRMGAVSQGRAHVYEGLISAVRDEVVRERSRLDETLGVRLEIHRKGHPEDDLAQLVHLKGFISTTYGHTPHDLSAATAAVRRSDALLAERGGSRLLVLAREQESGLVVGCAETVWWTDDPLAVYTWNLAVLERCRGRSLAGALNAALLLEVPRTFPAVESIRLRLHESAHGLQARCRRLGFNLHHTEGLWTVPEGSLADYLHGHRNPNDDDRGSHVG
ncbi:MAG: GNAT family N-acetyltransferase [Gemmatimonadota bacterium]